MILFNNLCGYAQSPFEFSIQRNTDKSIDFNYIKTEPGSFYLEVTIKNLRGSNDSEEQTALVINPTGKLFTLKPKPNESVSFESYNVKMAFGNPQSKVNKEYIYCYPFEKDVIFRVNEQGYLNLNYGA